MSFLLALALSAAITFDIDGEYFRIYNGTQAGVKCYVEYDDGEIDVVYVRVGRYSRWLDYWRYSSSDCY